MTFATRLVRNPAWLLSVLAFAVAVLLPGCSTEFYRKAADEDAMAIIHQKQEAVFGEVRPFQVEPSPEDQARLKLLAAVNRAVPAPGKKLEPYPLDLARCLDAAAALGREFQNEKELLFVSALSLSSTRWEFEWQPSLSGTVGVEGNRRDADFYTSATATLSKTLSTGASVLGSLLTSMSRSITSSATWDRSSLLSLGLTQPLLRGFGPDIALERLTQAERNVIYSVRSFERFRRRYVVSITSDYYGLLQQLDRIDIEKANLSNLNVNLELQTALYQAGKIPKYQVDQTEQSVLGSEATLLRLRQSLKTSMDAFKITLGLPVEAEIDLDREEFAELQKRGIKELTLNQEQAVALALRMRLDLKTSQDKIQDAERQVVVAADALRMGLDLNLDADLPTQDNRSWQADWKNVSLGASLDWDLPLDRTRQRNTYRSAIVSFERAVRDHDLLTNTVMREVRSRIRDLIQIEQNYKIQERRVKLAVKQVDETTEKMRAGRAITRDLLDAQDALVNAQSTLSSLLVDYKTAQLQLLRDLDILEVDPEGLMYDDRLENYRSSGKDAGEK